MDTQSEKKCLEAVEKLLEWQGGSIAELARVANVSRVAAFKWLNSGGRVGEGAAVLLGNLPGAPLTPQQIRPDLPKGYDKAYMTPETKAAIKERAAYIRERDAQRKKKAAADAKALAKLAKAKPRLTKRIKPIIRLMAK
jgi:hypothetical protein